MATWSETGDGLLVPVSYGPAEVKESATNGAIVDVYGPSQPVYTKNDFAALAKAGFNVNVYAYRAVMGIAQACAGIRLKVYEGDNPVDAHPMADRLNRPNAEQGQAQFIEQLVAFWMLAGNSYGEAVREGKDNTGQPLELHVLRPDRMRVLPDAKNRVGGYVYAVGGNETKFDKANILHLKLFAALDDWYGLSPLLVAAKSVDQMNAANDWNTALMQNGGRPSGALVTAGTLSPENKTKLRAQLRDRYTGARNAGTPLLLEGGLDWKAFGFSPADMDWLQGKRENKREIAVAYGYPSELLADGENNTYSNRKEARKGLYTETVLPLMDRLCDRLTVWLAPMYAKSGQDAGRYRIGYDKNDIEALAEDREAVWNRAVNAWDKGLLKRGEARELVGLKSGPEDDVYKAASPSPATPQNAPQSPNGGTDAQGGANTQAPAQEGTDAPQGASDGPSQGDGPANGGKGLYAIPKMLAGRPA